MRTKKGDWVVCLHTNLEPSTWAKVTDGGDKWSHVEYGEEAPIWDSPFWDNDYLKVVGSEAEARKVVEDHEASIDYDPR